MRRPFWLFCHQSSRENPAMLICNAKNRHVFQDRVMRKACDSDSRCGLACDASGHDAKSLGWRVCRTKFAQKIFRSLCGISHDKCSEVFSRYFWAFILCLRKIPQNFPPNFSPKNQKKFTDELLQERGGYKSLAMWVERCEPLSFGNI